MIKNTDFDFLPEFKEVITSPINASIKSAAMNVGTQLKEGQSILLLNKSATEKEAIKLKFHLETKRNEIQKLKFDLGKSFLISSLIIPKLICFKVS